MYIYIDVRMCIYIYAEREREVGVISSSITLLVYAVQFSPNSVRLPSTPYSGMEGLQGYGSKLSPANIMHP